MRAEAPYEELRPLLFSIAYRMVSSVSEAEDIVQEAFLRVHGAEAEGTKVDSPKAYLSAGVTRLSLPPPTPARAPRGGAAPAATSSWGSGCPSRCRPTRRPPPPRRRRRRTRSRWPS